MIDNSVTWEAISEYIMSKEEQAYLFKNNFEENLFLLIAYLSTFEPPITRLLQFLKDNKEYQVDAIMNTDYQTAFKRIRYNYYSDCGMDLVVRDDNGNNYKISKLMFQGIKKSLDTNLYFYIPFMDEFMIAADDRENRVKYFQIYIL